MISKLFFQRIKCEYVISSHSIQNKRRTFMWEYIYTHEIIHKNLLFKVWYIVRNYLDPTNGALLPDNRSQSAQNSEIFF